MRKITLLLLLNCCCFSLLFGQVEAIGSNEYGRIFGVTYDKTIENKLYAITLGNHILSSNDNGQTWDIFYAVEQGYFNKLENNLKNYGEDKLTFVTNTSGTEFGRTVNVLNTISGQIDHQYTAPNPNPGGNNFLSSYSVSASDENYAILSIGYPLGFGAAETTYYTTDGGATWAVIYDSTQNMDIIPGQVAIHPESPEKLYIARGNGNTDVDGGLLISEDGGVTWTEKIAGIVLNPIAFNPANADEVWVGTGISFGEYPEGLYKSTDGGDTWNEIEIEWTDYLLDCINVIQFNPSDPQNVIILEDNEVAISNDGGATWDVHVYENALDVPEDYSYGLDASFNPFNENEIFISANYYPMFSTNKGETMERVKTPYFVGESLSYFNNGEEEHLYYGVQSGFSHRNIQTSEETGYDIMPLNFVTNNSGTGAKIDENIVGRVYSFSGGFLGSSLKVSDNHGDNATEIYSTFSSSLHDVKSLPGNENVVWASFSSFGENPEIYEIDFSDINNIQSNSISLPNSSGVVMGFLFGENDETAIAVRGSRVHKTIDGGNSWTEISTGLEPLNVNNDMIFKIVQNPLDANQMSITSNKGIFTTTDGGENWTRINNLFVHNVKHSTTHQGHIIAATHDSNDSQFGLRYSKDAGETWTEIANENFMYLSSTSVFGSTDFNFYDDYADIFISTSGLGIVKYTLDLTTMSVGDPEFISENSVAIYPNPATDVVNISSKEEIVSVEIIGLTGQKLLNSTAKQINVSHLNKGIYIVKVQLANGNVETHKLVKK